MTLLDYPGKVAATVFLGGCDFRCPYCHNFELVLDPPAPIMSEEEFFSFLEKRRGILDGIAVTGGEPCLRPDLGAFLRKIKDKGYLVKLDTNGNHPDLLEDLIRSQVVDYVAMDIKNCLHKYGQTIGVAAFDTAHVERSIRLLMEGKIDYEFRTTVVKQLHKDEDFEAIGEMIGGAKAYFLQQYVERDTVPDKNLIAPDEEDMNRFLEIVQKRVPNARIRGL
jgi:pyruvate formate lyase activating enzyme